MCPQHQLPKAITRRNHCLFFSHHRLDLFLLEFPVRGIISLYCETSFTQHNGFEIQPWHYMCPWFFHKLLRSITLLECTTVYIFLFMVTWDAFSILLCVCMCVFYPEFITVLFVEDLDPHEILGHNGTLHSLFFTNTKTFCSNNLAQKDRKSK